MGKRSLRNRPNKELVKKENIDNVRKKYVRWMNQELASFSAQPDASIQETMIGLIEHWADESRCELFISYSRRVSHLQSVCWIEIMGMINGNENDVDLAKLWHITLHISVHVYDIMVLSRWHYGRTQLLHLVNVVKEHDEKIQTSSMWDLIGKNILNSPYCYAKSRFTLTQWLHRMAPRLAKLQRAPQSDICGRRIRLVVAVVLEDKSYEVNIWYINSQITVKC